MSNYFIILSNLDKKNAINKYAVEEIDLINRPSFKRKEILDKENLEKDKKVFLDYEEYKFKGYKCSTTKDILNTLPNSFRRPRSAIRNRRRGDPTPKDVTCNIVLQLLDDEQTLKNVEIFSKDEIFSFENIYEEKINKGDEIRMDHQLYRVEGFRLGYSGTILDKLPSDYKRPTSSTRKKSKSRFQFNTRNYSRNNRSPAMSRPLNQTNTKNYLNRAQRSPPKEYRNASVKRKKGSYKIPSKRMIRNSSPILSNEPLGTYF